MPDVKSMVNDAHLKFGDERGSSQDFNVSDAVADGVLIGSIGIIPVNHEVWRRNKQMRKST